MKNHRQRPEKLRYSRLLLFSAFLCISNLFQGIAQSNLLQNPSFETPGLNPLRTGCIWNDLPVWDRGFPNGASRCVAYCPNGTTIANFYPFLSQEIETVPGRRYYVSFASQVNGITVAFGDDVVNTLTNRGGTNFYYNSPWFYSYCHVTAVSNRTRFSLNSTEYVNVDDVLVGWLDEPVRITDPPVSTQVPEGGRLTLQVQAEGGPPLIYQWFKDSTAILNATNPVVYFSDASKSLEGLYHVVISNPVSQAVSVAVDVSVDTTSRAPQIVLHPESLNLIQGSYVSLRAGAVGTPPLRYQWRFNGTNLLDQTNTFIPFMPLYPEHSGKYDVVVENRHGSTVSLEASITVKTSGRVALLSLNNFFPISLRRPIYDVDGITPLAGTAYQCQPYVGPSPDSLTAMSTSRVFRTNPPGTYLPWSIYVTMPEESTNWTTFVQMRAWESEFGDSYELARAQGGKVGVSPLVQFNLTPPEIPPTTYSTPSFNLRAGLPGFTTGRLSRGGKNDDGEREWILTGAKGYSYLVERRQPPDTWLPLVILTNITGTVRFSDPDEHSAPLRFYRARMLD